MAITNKKISSEKERKLIITAVLALILIIALFEATLAYLATTTNTLDNVTEAGKVSAYLDEKTVDSYGKATTGRQQTGQTFTLLPDCEYTKDPQMHIEKGSEDCYAYIILDDQLLSTISTVYEGDSPETQMTANGWTEITDAKLPSGKTGKVYYYNSVITKDKDNDKTINTFTSFTLNTALTSDQITSLGNKHIIVNGAVIQSCGFNNATDAWHAVYGQAYKVTYNGNGNTSGTVPTDTTQYAPSATVTVLDNTGSLAKTGYVFSEWNTDPDGSGASYKAGDAFTITGNTTLYAMYVVGYTVTYDANGASSGTAPSSETYATGSSVTVAGKGSLANTDYTFCGWNTESDGSGTPYVENNTFPITEDTTLYAQWYKPLKVKTKLGSSTTETDVQYYPILDGSTLGKGTSFVTGTESDGVTKINPTGTDSAYQMSDVATAATAGTLWYSYSGSGSAFTAVRSVNKISWDDTWDTTGVSSYPYHASVLKTGTGSISEKIDLTNETVEKVAMETSGIPSVTPTINGVNLTNIWNAYNKSSGGFGEDYGLFWSCVLGDSPVALSYRCDNGNWVAIDPTSYNNYCVLVSRTFS